MPGSNLMSKTQRYTVPAQFDQLQRIAELAVEAAIQVGFDAAQQGRIELAMDEACSNIIEHAYAGAAGHIFIEVETEPKHYLKIVLSDTGRTFAPNEIPLYVPCTPATDVASLKVGGLGLHLMRQTMDDVCFEFNVPGQRGVFNRLTMIKRL